MVLVQCLHTVVRGIVRFHFYDSCTLKNPVWCSSCSGQELSISLSRRSLQLCIPRVACLFGSAHAHFANCRSTEIDWTNIYWLHRWFPYGSGDMHVSSLFEAVVPYWKRDASRTFGVDGLYAASDAVWVRVFANRFRIASAVVYKRLPI